MGEAFAWGAIGGSSLVVGGAIALRVSLTRRALGLIMAFNVWFIIWPNQKKVLGIVEATPEAKKRAGRIAMLTSRVNTMLSIPMLYAMVSAQNIY